jgi:uncharacterized protein (TIGR03437 family)
MSKLFLRNALAALALILPATALAAPAPVINAVVNNFSYTQQGLPSYGIAPASLFVIYGANMCDNVPLVVQTSSGPGLPHTLNGLEIFVNVKGVVTIPAIYYATPTQVAAVLPSTTPVGTGTITVKYNDQTGVAPFVVTKAAFGILTTDGIGTGPVKAFNLNYQNITPTASAAPGQIIILWGSGLGADLANNDRTYPMKQDNLNDATVYIGGVKADVYYAGRSQYPGEDQIDVFVPELGAAPAFEAASFEGRDVPRASTGFQGGCTISVIVVANGITSNVGTLPVAVGNGICQDNEYGVTGSGFPQSSMNTVTVGGLGLFQIIQSNGTYYYAEGNFFSEPGSDFVSGAPYVSPGSCLVYTTTATKPALRSSKPALAIRASTGAPINEGPSLTLSGLNVTLPQSSNDVGLYSASFFTPAPQVGATYNFLGDNISASFGWAEPLAYDFGSASAGAVMMPGALAKPSTTDPVTGTITESQGQLITWTGGTPESWVIVQGSSTSSTVPLTVNFYCTALASAQQLMLPSYVLDTLPAGSGTLTVENEQQPQTFTAKGIDYGYVSSGLITYADVTYQLGASTTPPPPAQSPYNGSYTGTFSGTEGTNGKTISGAVAASIDNGVLTVTSPGSGTGDVSSTGAITFGVAVSEGITCNFSGQDVVTAGVATATGTFTCAYHNTTGTWTITTGG